MLLLRQSYMHGNPNMNDLTSLVPLTAARVRVSAWHTLL